MHTSVAKKKPLLQAVPYNTGNIESSEAALQTKAKKKHEAWLAGLPAQVACEVAKVDVIPKVIAVGGGKGGVGKSIISANIAARLGQAGFKVLLVDLDFGSANLHTYFGIVSPSFTLTDFVLYDACPFEKVLINTQASGVSLAAGGRDETWSDAADFGTEAFASLWSAFLCAKRDLGFDFIVLDLGAGTHRHTIDFFSSAHMGIVTVLPEPTSIENAYSFLKATLWRLIENAGMHVNACASAEDIKEHVFAGRRANDSKGSQFRLLQEFHSKYPDLVAHILLALQGRQIGFVINQIRSQRDIEIGSSMECISRSFFGFDTKFLGYLNYDDAAWKSLRNRRLLVMDFPHCILTKRIGEVASRILSNLEI